jgi:hypothetical protein
MSEETNVQDHNDGTWSGLKKTIIGTLSTAVLGAGTWVTTTFFAGHKEDKDEPKTEQVAPSAQPTIVINNTQQQQQAAGGTKVIERVVEKPAAKPAEPAPKKKEFSEEPKW